MSFPYKHVLRQKYNNRRKLQKVLNTMFGQDNYGVQIEESHWLLLLPRQLSESELTDIESQIRVHYNV